MRKAVFFKKKKRKEKMRTGMKRKILEYLSDAKAVVPEAPVWELPGLGGD